MIAIAVLFSTFQNLHAQESESVEPLAKKNLIGVNISPVISGLTGANTINPFTSLQYKRVYDNQSFRINANYFYSDGWFFGPYNESITSFSDTAITDSLTIGFESTTFSSHRADIRFGWEWHFGKQKINWILGGDLVFGYSQRQYNTRTGDRTYILDSLGGVERLERYGAFDTGTYLDETYHYGLVGLSPVLGMEIPVGKRFSIGAQFNPIIFYQIGFTKNESFIDSDDESNSYNVNSDINYSSFNFDIGAASVFVNFLF